MHRVATIVRLVQLLILSCAIVGCGNGSSKNRQNQSPVVNTTPSRPRANVGLFQEPNERTPGYPIRAAVSGDGTVYVSDFQRQAVLGMTAGHVTTWLAGLADPIGIAVAGNWLYIGNRAAAIAVDDTCVVVGDQGNHRIQIFDLQGNWQRSFGEGVPETAQSQSDYQGRFTRVQGLALAGQKILVLDSYHSHVQMLGRDGASLGFFGQAGTCDGCVALALDIALGTDGALVVTDPEHARTVAWPVQPTRTP